MANSLQQKLSLTVLLCTASKVPLPSILTVWEVLVFRYSLLRGTVPLPASQNCSLGHCACWLGPRPVFHRGTAVCPALQLLLHAIHPWVVITWPRETVSRSKVSMYFWGWRVRGVWSQMVLVCVSILLLRRTAHKQVHLADQCLATLLSWRIWAP